jgi:hypothetical protein
MKQTGDRTPFFPIGKMDERFEIFELSGGIYRVLILNHTGVCCAVSSNPAEKRGISWQHDSAFMNHALSSEGFITHGHNHSKWGIHGFNGLSISCWWVIKNSGM